MNQVAILYPVFVQVLLTFCVYALLTFARSRALKDAGRTRGSSDLAMGRFQWPEDAEKRAANQRNQFELPVLFYVLCIALALTGATTPGLVTAAWVYVGLRALHSLIHVTYNRVVHRFLVYVASTLLLFGMWVAFFLALAP